MRIIMSLNDYTDGACGLFKYGEVEDFCLEIKGSAESKEGLLKTTNFTNQLSSEGEEDSEALDRVETRKVSIFPNPASQPFRILTPDKELISAEIINLEGKRIRKIQDFSNAVSIDDLSPGMYYIRLINVEGKQQVEKLIIE